MQDRIREQFDETLAGHFERLIGTREGILGLPLNLATISCFVLLAEREHEIGNASSETPDRYTIETLFSEAAGIGMRSGDVLDTSLRTLRDKGYVDDAGNGRLIACKPALSMARLMNLVFPKMAGIGFLAYAGQALDEAVTERVDVASAIDRFSQTLMMHGVLPGKRKPEEAAARTTDSVGGTAARPGRSVSVQPGGTDRKRAGIGREALLQRLKKKVEADRPPSAASEQAAETPRIAPAAPVLKPHRRENAPPADLHSVSGEEGLPAAIEEKPVPAADPVPEEQSTQTSSEGAVDGTQDEVPPSVPDAVSGPEEMDEAPEAVSEIPPDTSGTEGEGVGISDGGDIDVLPSAVPEEREGGSAAGNEEEAVEKRVADFEKRLALTCPLCRERVLIEKTTPAGKMYYVCPDDACGFISWGKPHHIECPRCRNPFMVEAESASGEKILKCPRATCQHRRSLNPVRRVVRRKVVRRT